MCDLLASWIYAIGDGRVRYWQPDPNYTRHDGSPGWSVEELDHLVCAIDDELRRASDTDGIHYPERAHRHGFRALAVAQRLALAQQLDGLEKDLKRRGTLYERDSLLDWVGLHSAVMARREVSRQRKANREG